MAEPVPAGFAAPFHEARGDAFLAKKDNPGAIKEYQAALGASDAAGINASLLELKIQDLGAVPATPVKVSTVSVANKAKP